MARFNHTIKGYIKNTRKLRNTREQPYTSARSMQPPNIQLTLQSLYPIGSTKPFKGWPLAMLPSLMQSRILMTGVSRLMLCSIEILMSMSSATRPSLIAPTASSRVLSSPTTNVGVGLNAHEFQSGFCIWWESPCGCLLQTSFFLSLPAVRYDPIRYHRLPRGLACTACTGVSSRTGYDVLRSTMTRSTPL